MSPVPCPLPASVRRSVTILLTPVVTGAVTLVGQAAPAVASPPATAPLAVTRTAPAPLTSGHTAAARTAASGDLPSAGVRLRRGTSGSDVGRATTRATLSTTRRPAPGTPAFGQLILKLALKHRGKPYRYGASGPSAFDCSGLTRWVYREAGYSLPRSSRAQRAATRAVARPAPGDLGFVRRNGVVRHVGIYVGNGRWFEASTRSKPIGYGKARWGSNISFGRVG